MINTHDNKLQKVEQFAKSPFLANPQNYSDQDLLDKMSKNGLLIDSLSLVSLMPKFERVEFLLNYLLVEHGIESNAASDWIYFCLIELWRRWLPNRLVIEHISDLIGEGLDHELTLYERTAAAKCYQESWQAITSLMERLGMHSFAEFETIHNDSPYEFLEIFVALASILCDLGQNNGALYYAECISFCTEVLERLPENDVEYHDAIEGIRSYLAKSYLGNGDREKAIYLLEQWLVADPSWGIGWLDLSEIYEHSAEKDLAKAEQVLQKALCVPELRDRIDVLDRCCEILSKRVRTSESRKMLREMEPLSKSTKQKILECIKKMTKHNSLEQLSKIKLQKTVASKKNRGSNEMCSCGRKRKCKKNCKRGIWN